MKLAILLLTLLVILVFLTFCIMLFKENEKRASIVALLFGSVLSASLLVLALVFSNNVVLIAIVLLIYLFFAMALLIPYVKKSVNAAGYPELRYDERQIMFSRAKLIADTERFNDYYQNNSEHKKLDDRFRQKPGLLSKKSQKYHPLKFASTCANFELVDLFVSKINDKPVETEQDKTEPAIITNYIKKWAKQIGVVSIGVTELKDVHLYSHKGRGDEYGKKIKKEHKYAIVFTLEMNKSMVDMSPDAEIVLESSQQYLNGANIACQIAAFIRNLGYSARPHFDGNYEVICPLVARDAGLGEIGRMGLLMTPELGPRVRIGVVTTDIPLIHGTYIPDYRLFNFCTICKKCAINCPSKAISFDAIEKDSGVTRWKINHEACFTYWTTIGTDCGKCIQVCPYSHPDNFMHNLIRKGIKNYDLFSLFALRMDDFFYGSKRDNKSYKSPLD